MKIVELHTKEHVRAFHALPFTIYKEYPQWIPHLKQDVEKVFNPKKNKAFRHGEATRFLLYSNDLTVIGRIAVFINRKTAKTFKQPTGGIGFFECIPSEEAAFMLFDACKNWLSERGMEAMDGPVNFGEKNEYWGLLVDGYQFAPAYQVNYHPPYYRKFFENYGFKTYYEQYIYWRNLLLPAEEIFRRKAEPLLKDPNFTIKNIVGMSDAHLADAFLSVYNKAWGGSHVGFKPMNKTTALAIMKSIKPVKDPHISLFAYYGKEPVGFYINLPELNQLFRYAKGNLNLWGKLMFLFHRYKKTASTMYGIVFGVVPEFQGKGVEAAMILHTEKHIVPMGHYKDTLITWIGDFNIPMLKVCENLHLIKQRTLITYRYLFNPNAVFERAPYLGRKKQSNPSNTNS
jgi:GNAT superfamily N-acetyltransferase